MSNEPYTDTAHSKNKEVFGDWESMACFASISPGKRWVFSLMGRIFLRIDKKSVGTILDVGCGIGEKTSFLKERFPDAHAVGVDFSEDGIEIANNRYAKVDGLDFICSDADDKEIWSKSYDMISCFETLEHLDDWMSLVDKFASCSSKYILLTFPTGRMRKFEVTMAGHVRNFQKNEMEDYLKSLGFKPFMIFYAGFPFFNPIGRELAQLFHKFRYKKLIRSSKQSLLSKLYSRVVYFLLRFCSTKYRFGNQFIGMFEKDTGAL